MQTIEKLVRRDALAAAVADDHRDGFVSPPSHARIIDQIGAQDKITGVMLPSNHKGDGVENRAAGLRMVA
ncbi:MAG TPA: hypothetical protein VMS96_04150 [Terriglobales bacterium]|nr:hypothetical protein [Terriglobales bacterium]